jgi:hypothetical protein
MMIEREKRRGEGAGASASERCPSLARSPRRPPLFDLETALPSHTSLTPSHPLSSTHLLQYGEDAIKEGMGGGGPGGGGGMADIFEMFAGGGRGRGGPPRERKGDNVVHRLKVSLEDMFRGSTR